MWRKGLGVLICGMTLVMLAAGPAAADDKMLEDMKNRKTDYCCKKCIPVHEPTCSAPCGGGCGAAPLRRRLRGGPRQHHRDSRRPGQRDRPSLRRGALSDGLPAAGRYRAGPHAGREVNRQASPRRGASTPGRAAAAFFYSGKLGWRGDSRIRAATRDISSPNPSHLSPDDFLVYLVAWDELSFPDLSCL
jgi:hypothetical protein